MCAPVRRLLNIEKFETVLSPKYGVAPFNRAMSGTVHVSAVLEDPLASSSHPADHMIKRVDAAALEVRLPIRTVEGDHVVCHEIA